MSIRVVNDFLESNLYEVNQIVIDDDFVENEESGKHIPNV